MIFYIRVQLISKNKMKNTNRQKNLIILLTFLLILTLTWVISSIYHSYVNSTIELPLAQDIIPIEGKFDTKTIEEIKTRKRVEVTNDIITLTEDSLTKKRTATPTAQLDNNSNSKTGTKSAETEL